MPKSHFDTRRAEVPVRIDRARQTMLAIEQVFEVCTILFETRRVDIGHVIGNHVELGLKGFHASGSGIKSLNAHDYGFQ